MGKAYTVSFYIWLLTGQLATAQTAPFTGSWHFEGNNSGSSSNPLVSVSDVSFSGVNLLFGTYQSGSSGLGISLQHWSTSGCNYAEYAQFSVQPQGTARITLTSLSFTYSRSATGPTLITVRSSVDGFASDIYSQTVGTNYQTASISLNGSGFINQSSGITFRIYGCSSNDSNGTMRIDEIQINGSSLPVTLLSFTAKPDGDRVQLAWTTTSEYQADHFVVERSRDLDEYVVVGEVPAKGTSDERQVYGLTDLNPWPGVNYYRLKQIDRDGTSQSFKPISAIIRSDESVVSVYPNPANSDRIHLRLWNADYVLIQLLTNTGQSISGRLEKQAGEADLTFDQPLPAGLYWLEVWTNGQKRVIKVVVLN